MSNSHLDPPDNVTIAEGGQAAPRVPAERDLAMRIGRDGTWYYRDSPIERPAIVNLFARILKREKDGTYWLVTPAERGRIEVYDAPFIAVGLLASGQGRHQVLRFRTNVEVDVTAGRSNPIRVHSAPDGGAARPYLLVRPGLEALISRPVYYQLVDLAELSYQDGQEVLGVWSDGVFFALGSVDADAAHE